MPECVGGGASSEPRTWTIWVDRRTDAIYVVCPRDDPVLVADYEEVRVVEQQPGTEGMRDLLREAWNFPDAPSNKAGPLSIAEQEAIERFEADWTALDERISAALDSTVPESPEHQPDDEEWQYTTEKATLSSLPFFQKGWDEAVAAVVEVLRNLDASLSFGRTTISAADFIESHPRFKAEGKDRTMSDLREQMDEMFPSVAWDRVGLVSEWDFVRRYSRQHRYVPEGDTGSDHALCGARIRWMYCSPGDSTRCERCDAIALERAREALGDRGSPS
jgi:hypothetical protein